jgi:hypothetical protein
MPTIELKLTLPINTATVTVGTKYELKRGIRIYGWTIDAPTAGATDIWLPLFRVVHVSGKGPATLLPNAGEKYLYKEAVGLYVPEMLDVTAGTIQIEGVSGGTAAAHTVSVTVHFVDLPVSPEYPELESPISHDEANG